LALRFFDPGPMMTFRGDDPKVPADGIANASVLNQRSIVGSSIVVGAPS
jgi:hypothetical protein